MHMRNVSSRLFVAAALAALAAAGISSTPAYAQCAPAKVSAKLAKPLKAAQEAINAKQWQTALSKLAEANAVAGKTTFDQHMINEFQGFAYVRTGQMGDAARELEAGLNSGCLAEGERPTRVRALAQINYQLKNYDKSIEYGNRAIRGGYADSDMYTLVGQAIYVKGDYKASRKFFEDFVGDIEKRGQTPKEQTLQLLMSSCVKLDDSACITSALERLVVSYPKSEYWNNLVFSLLREGGTSDAQTLNIFRLASGVDVLKRGDHFSEMAQLALEQGLPGEAQTILEQGFAKNAFTDQRDKDKNTRLLQSAKTRAAQDKASLAQQEKATAANKVGEPDVKIGAAYLSYAQPDKAVAAITRGLGKGGVKNVDEANLLLGMANLQLNNKADAAKAFKAVKSDPKLARVAKLWLLKT
jgi:tetratricopeptide (TPR) repeat protein